MAPYEAEGGAKPLREGALRPQGPELSDSSDEGGARELVSQGHAVSLLQRVQGGALAFVLLLVLLLLVSLLALVTVIGRRWGPSSSADWEDSKAAYGVAYDFVGEGNCKPNRPQWARPGASWVQCRAACDEADRCIGFDWDSKYTFCRVRFASNAATALPPPGFVTYPGTEGGRLRAEHRGLPAGPARPGASGVITGIEGSHTAGCFQKARALPFFRLLSNPAPNIGPLPNILEYYAETGLEGPRQLASRHLRATGRLLEYNGSSDEMILPSLDAWPVLRALQKETLDSITVIVGINSDARGRIGLALEASPEIKEVKKHVQHGTGTLPQNRNVVTFEPDAADGSLKIESAGASLVQELSTTPPGWSRAGARLNVLEVTAGRDGRNEALLRTAAGAIAGRVAWRHRLFDGRDVPAVYALRDWTSEARAPLVVGRVTLRARR